jgi:hypothetical protein
MDKSNAKGYELERHFAEWMKHRLHYTDFKFRERVKGRVSNYGYEVDIKARKFDPMWDNVRLLGAGLILLAVLSATLPQFRSIRYSVEQAVGTVVPALAPYGLLVLGFIAAVVGIGGRNRSVRYTWVECKNTRKPVTRDHIIKLAAYLNDIHELDSVPWQPDDIFFVAGESGFDQDAINFIREHKFVPYQRAGEDYRLVA